MPCAPSSNVHIKPTATNSTVSARPSACRGSIDLHYRSGGSGSPSTRHVGEGCERTSGELHQWPDAMVFLVAGWIAMKTVSTEPFRNIVQREESVPTYRCPCCKFKTLCGRGQDEICKVCFWHDDCQDEHDAEVVRGGPNYHLSLRQAQANYHAYGAVELRHRTHVRLPTPEEQ